MNRRTVLSEHRAIYADPISVIKGDILLLGKSDVWDTHTWVWATAENGKSGWVPDNLAWEKNGRMVAAYDYSAFEISCSVGDSIEIILEDHGWAWCKTESHEEGWIPLRNLSDNLI